MDIRMIAFSIISLTIFGLSACIYQDNQYNEQQQYYKEPLYSKPPPRILSHHQSQNHDGGFKFAFSAENGLAQSEVILPDGSRNGGYSYVDPHGKTITVKYTAGKEGFKILEGEHIPKETSGHGAASHSPQQHQNHNYLQQQKQQSYQQPQLQQYHHNSQQPHYSRQDEGQYTADKYTKPLNFKPQYAPQKHAYIAPQSRNYIPSQEAGASNSVEDHKEPDYNDEPGKAYSFGTGYAFHFAN